MFDRPFFSAIDRRRAMTATSSQRLNDELADFRRRNPPRTVDAAGTTWRYVAAGGGGEATDTLLLLPGALGSADLGFQLISALSRRMRVVSPYYLAAGSVGESLAAIEAILGHENVDAVTVLGGSFGGTLAQCWASAHPARTRHMILSHSIAPNPAHARRMSISTTVARLLPWPACRALMRRRVGDLLPTDFEEREFWQALLTELTDAATKPYFINVMRCLREFFEGGTAGVDLDGWGGDVLILESDNDTSVNEQERAALRALYPEARVHTFHGSGHASSIVETSAYVEVVRRFLATRKPSTPLTRRPC